MMPTTKEEILESIRKMPDDATTKDVLEHLYVRYQVEMGRADVEAGNTIPHEEVKKRFESWIKV